jgi:SAM-dependent methyltransferase
MHLSSLEKMEKFCSKYLAEKRSESLQVLDLGSQDVNGSYKQFFDVPSWRYVGMDMYPGKNVDIVLKDPYDWGEIATGSVDVLISGQAFEHIEFFWITMQEIARVLKPNGLCCIIAPAGGYEHRYPLDCWRFYPDGFSALARFAKLHVEEVYTQWDSAPYADGSEIWKDSVLIARKPFA